ncbi:hypothetical protein D3H35_01830 [Cohnella faecalis]|uniref:Uncharacterized protein n=1 Tax=Cohnella faecalis TaxID=2315694 RepID=A0A398CRV3_9BACL|nr:hypothetical protein D3H35_01830 [Cohnella faecalis]
MTAREGGILTPTATAAIGLSEAMGKPVPSVGLVEAAGGDSGVGGLWPPAASPLPVPSVGLFDSGLAVVEPVNSGRGGAGVAAGRSSLPRLNTLSRDSG